MTVLLPERERRTPLAKPNAARTLDTLATLLIVVFAVAILYLARAILVPVAIAVLLSFVLSPLVKALRRHGIRKKIAVGLVVLLTFLVAVGLGAVLAKQISDLVADTPRYQATVAAKADALRTFAADNPIIAKLNGVIADVAHMAPLPSAPSQQEQRKEDAGRRGTMSHRTQLTPASGPAPDAGTTTPVQVEVVTPPPGVLTILQNYAGTAATPLATAAFVAIFIVFILMQREDLRNRFIRLVGYGDLQRTTLAMTDAAERLSRYLVAQMLLNIGFGAVVGCALALIGVPSAVMWGIIAAIMRFIPYVGAIGAAIGPILMSAVANAGWSMTVETAIFFAGMEAIVGQVVEPLVFGSRTGISPIAVVASATFWTWLWGPIGLVLATPLTVCLVVMGRHVERFAFLDVLLGDEPALSPVESFYQRMLAGDPSEIVDHAAIFLRDRSLLDYCEEVALPTLLLAQADVRRGMLEEDRQTHIRDVMRLLVEDADETEAFEAEGDEETARRRPAVDEAWRRAGAVICVAGHTPLDEAAALLLADLLRREGLGARIAPAAALTSPDDEPSAWSGAQLLVLSFLDADLRLAQARFAVRRLRRRAPGVPIASAFWMAQSDPARATELCANVRCDACIANLRQALALCLERAGIVSSTLVGDDASMMDRPRDKPELVLDK